MIHSMGDSHAYFTFAGTGVKFHALGPVTMKRLGSGRVRKDRQIDTGFVPASAGIEYVPDTILQDTIDSIPASPDNVFLLSCGEGDVRCFIKPHLEASGDDASTFIQFLVDAYVARVAALDFHGGRVALASVAPPTTWKRASTYRFPAAGTDAERVAYTRTMNMMLERACALNGFTFVDTFERYSDADGMLRLDIADGSVHVLQTLESAKELRERLIGLGLMT